MKCQAHTPACAPLSSTVRRPVKALVSSALAFLIAPLAPAAGAALTSPGIGGGLSAGIVELSGVMFFVFYPYALMFELVIGLPLFLLARRFGLVRWWSATLGGVVVGLLALIAFSGVSAFSSLPASLLWIGSGGVA